MASKYGSFVHGVDLSVNMVTTALERAFAAKDGHKVVTCPAHMLLDMLSLPITSKCIGSA